MKTNKIIVVLVKDGYELLKAYIHSSLDTLSPEIKNAEQLLHKIQILCINRILPGIQFFVLPHLFLIFICQPHRHAGIE